MQNSYLLETLKDIGLSEKEAQVYITLLSLGSSAVSTVARKTAQNRSGCYATLAKLMQKGYVQQIIKNNVSYYIAVEPKYIVDQLKTTRFELENKIENLTQIMDQFKHLQTPYHGKSKVVFYEGKAGIQNIMEDTLSAKELIRAYASVDDLLGILPDYLPRYYQRRIQKGIFVRGIYPVTAKSLFHKNRDKENLRESRLIPEEYDFHLDILIYDNKVAITSLRENFGIIIENKDIADAQKRIFDLMWKYSKKLDKKIGKKKTDFS
jgi:sugar-specific transcriptional regulator TrmB